MTPRYRIGALIGQGGMAAVHRGWRIVANGTAHAVALKKIRAEYRGNRDVLRLFEQEWRYSMDITHQNLVRVLDFAHDEDKEPCLVMELVEGVTLDVVIATGGLSFAEIRRIAVSVLDALAYLHDRGIAHGDVSSSNILLTYTGEIKLIDLGLATAVNEPRETGQFAGTIAYTNPETMNHVSIMPSAELFSFAAVLYHAITGRTPFGESELAEVWQRMQDESAPRLPTRVPKDLRRAVHGALQFEPAERAFGSAREMRDVLAGQTGKPGQTGHMSQRQPIATPDEMAALVKRVLQASDSRAVASISAADLPVEVARMPRWHGRRGAWLGLFALSFVLLCLTGYLLHARYLARPEDAAAVHTYGPGIPASLPRTESLAPVASLRTQVAHRSVEDGGEATQSAPEARIRQSAPSDLPLPPRKKAPRRSQSVDGTQATAGQSRVIVVSETLDLLDRLSGRDDP